MLGLSDAKTLTTTWDQIHSKASLPTSATEFFCLRGPLPDAGECRRAHERYFLRTKAILKRRGEWHAIYLQDCSRTGVGIISPVQLFPSERVQIWIPDNPRYMLQIVRCRRIKSQSYECGTIFHLKLENE